MIFPGGENGISQADRSIIIWNLNSVDLGFSKQTLNVSNWSIYIDSE